MQESTDKDIHVDSPEAARALLAELKKRAPEIRWSVDDRMQDTRQFYGIESPDLRMVMQTFPLTFRQGGVRFNGGKLEVMMSKQAERDIRRGILRIDEEMLERVPTQWHQRIIDRSVGRTRKMLGEYPGLKLEGRLKELYEKQYGAHKPSRILMEWERIQDEVWEQEYGGKTHWSSEDFTDSDRQYGLEVRDFYLNADKALTAPPRPDFSLLPEPLETWRERKLRLEMGDLASDSPLAEIPDQIAAPEKFNTWFEYIAACEDDAVFREWFLNQTRSRKPIGGKDVDVHRAMDLAKSERHVHRGDQKVTHMGLPLYKHTQEAVLQLSTDWLEQREDLDQSERKMIRRAMRTAMLYHDLGKLHNVNTPGCHEGIGAKIWQKNAPEWMSEEEKSLVTWIIRTHDLFGRLARGLTEKQNQKLDDADFDPAGMPAYQGALDPETVREYLSQSGLDLDLAADIHENIWRADVASVSALRWLLSASDLLKKMILTSDNNDC